MEEQNKPVYTIEELKENINIFLNKEFSNNRLADFIGVEFAKKGFPLIIPKQLFNNNKDVDSLTEPELIAFCIAVNKYFTINQDARKSEEYIKNINPSLYFYTRKISENELLQPKQDNKITEIVFEEVQKLNNNEFQTYLTAKQLYELDKAGQLVYLKEAQRASKKIKLKNGEVREVENYNKEGLKDLENRFLKQDLLITQVTLSIIIWDNKTPNIDFNAYDLNHENYGRLTFIPNFDSNSPNMAFINKADGAHRIGALITAYEKNNSIENQKLSVAIKIVKLPIIKQFINDTFKINETDRTYRDTLANTPLNNYINTIIDNSIFRNKTAKTKADEKIEAFYASYEYIKDTIKYLDIKLDKNDLMLRMEAKNVSNKINTLIDLFKDKYDYEDVSNLKSNTFLLDKKMCILYIIAGEMLKEATDENILKMYEYIINKFDNIKKILKLKNVKELIEEFDKLLKGCEL